jgi:hypothetical protein
MVGHQMPFLDPALFLFRQLAEHLAKILAQLHVQRPAAALRNENHVVFAHSLGVIYGSPTRPSMQLHIRVRWRLTMLSFVDGQPGDYPPQTSNFYCLPGRAGGNSHGD